MTDPQHDRRAIPVEERVRVERPLVLATPPGRQRMKNPGQTRVGMVSQWYPPEPITLPAQFATGLRDVGFAVRVLTGFPNYPSGEVAEGYRGKMVLREVADGIQILRTPLYASHDTSAIKRVLNYLSWASSATVGAARWFRRADVLLVYGSPITAAFPALLMKLLRGKPFVIQVQDLWPESISDSGFLQLPGTIDRIMRAVCAWVYHQAAACVVISPGMIDVLVDRGVPRDRIRLIYNWTDEKRFRPEAREGTLRQRLAIPDEERIVMYVGNLGPAQGLDCWIQAASDVDDCHLVLVGDGLERHRLQAITESLGAKNVHFYGAVSPDQVAALIAESDAQIVSLIDRAVFEATMPSKIQTSLACGAPVLVSVGGDAGRLIREAEAGISVPPGDVTGMQNALRQLSRATDAELETWGQNAQRLYESRMSRTGGLAALAHVVGRVARKLPLSEGEVDG